MIKLPRRSFLLGAAPLIAAPALIIRTPGLPPKVVPALSALPEPSLSPEVLQVQFRVTITGFYEGRVTTTIDQMGESITDAIAKAKEHAPYWIDGIIAQRQS